MFLRYLLMIVLAVICFDRNSADLTEASTQIVSEELIPTDFPLQERTHTFATDGTAINKRKYPETRFLRVHKTANGEADSTEFLDADQPADKRDEERGILAVIRNVALRKVKMKSYLARGVHPDKVMKKMKVTSKSSDNYQHYSKYFFDYYIKYLHKPLSHLPESVITDVMNARLNHWLGKNLSPPQVFSKLGLPGSWTSAAAKSHPDYKYFETYSNMWGREQARHRYD